MAFDSTKETTGYGKTLGYADTNNGSFTPIDGTFEFGFPEVELGEADITHDASPDRTKQYIPSMFEPGEVEFKARYGGGTAYATLNTIFLARTTKYWKVTLPDGSATVFPGYLKKFNLDSMNTEDALDITGSIRVTGKAVFTAAA